MTRVVDPGPAPVRRLSKSALTSLICGILGCLPFVTGALAVLLGIVGIVRTGNPAKKGRWMAVVGLLLGIVSLVAWSGASLVGGGIWALIKGTEGPRVAAHDFIKAAADGNDTAAKGLTIGMNQQDYDDIADYIRKQGSFQDTTFFATNIINDTAHISGIATFSLRAGGSSGVATRQVTAELKQDGGVWKVKEIRITE